MRLLTWDDLPPKGIHHHRQHLYRLIRQKKFPKPIRITENRVAFIEAEIDQYIADRIAARDKAA